MRPTKALIMIAVAARAAAAQQGMDTVRIQVQPLASGVYMLIGSGGNIGVSVGDDGPFIIDDQFAPLAPKIKAAIAGISNKPLRFVFNTHWHGDHTGGNEPMAGDGAIIVAHDNVRRRMGVDQFNKTFNQTTKASPRGALPVVTFADAVTFHLNGDSILAMHVAPAHTDGDAIVVFKKANVIHAGDTFMNGFYPFIDLDSGGSIDGVIAAADKILSMSDANTKIIPGHGPLASASDLREYRRMLVGCRDAVKKLVAAGRTLDQVKAAKPTADFDGKWGGGFMKPDQWVTQLYRGLSKK
jgi:glyoxylase-like metal-dependent hydrolase (beta-lactamase superfamily II)